MFAMTPYEPDRDGILRPVVPLRCVFAQGKETCSVFVDHYRPRKTGPGFPLAVVGCSAHRYGRYTLYPPGHFPYGRKPVAPYSASGHLARHPGTGEPLWEITLLDAAMDAASVEERPGEHRLEEPGRGRSRRRQLEVAGRVTGVHPEVDERARERIAARLGVATLALRTAAHGWARSGAMRGAAVLTVLAGIPLEVSLLDRVLTAGTIADLWAPPQRWDPAQRGWIGASSVRRERRLRGLPRGRSPPPTTLSGPTP